MDLLDTSGCPTHRICERCQSCADLAAMAVDTPLGVLCVTLCTDCRRQRRRPGWSGTHAALRVLQHCRHLGIDRSTMSAWRAQQAAGLPEVWFR
ncbi:hypothetical protein ACVGV0_12690 [Salinifilum ghardaiensis]